MCAGTDLFFHHFQKSEKCLFNSGNDSSRFLIVSNADAVSVLHGCREDYGDPPTNLWLPLWRIMV